MNEKLLRATECLGEPNPGPRGKQPRGPSSITIEDPEMKVSVSGLDKATVVEVSGRIDGATAKEFEESFAQNVPDGAPGAVVCDISGVDYISSAGLRAVLVVAKRFRGLNKPFSVCGHTGSVAEVFRISGFEKIIDMHGTREEALAATNT